MTAITVLVAYQVLPDQVDTALREIAALVATVEASEADCAGIRLLQDTRDPTRVTLVEQWSSQEIFLGPHMQQPHIQAFIQSAGAFLAGPPAVSFWRTVGSD